jgi:CDP-diacylglycerol--glycerol-3-phosphate 3-phosphatidyltransferase
MPQASGSDASAGKAKAKHAASFVVDPVARGLLALHVSPDAITILGSLGAVVASLWLFPTGHLVAGSIVVALFALSDMLDGSMARQSGRTGPWGAFLDSTLDRITDACVYVGLALWYLQGGDEHVLGYLALYCLVAGQIVSYARARAEGLDLTASGGIAERTERMVLILTTTGFGAMGVPYLQAIGLWVLAAASTFTVIQRMLMVRRQALPARKQRTP